MSPGTPFRGNFVVAWLPRGGVNYVALAFDRDALRALAGGGLVIPSSEAHRMACTILAVMGRMARLGDEEAEAALETTERLVAELSAAGGEPPGQVPGRVE